MQMSGEALKSNSTIIIPISDDIQQSPALATPTHTWSHLEGKIEEIGDLMEDIIRYTYV